MTQVHTYIEIITCWIFPTRIPCVALQTSDFLFPRLPPNVRLRFLKVNPPKNTQVNKHVVMTTRRWRELSDYRLTSTLSLHTHMNKPDTYAWDDPLLCTCKKTQMLRIKHDNIKVRQKQTVMAWHTPTPTHPPIENIYKIHPLSQSCPH